MKNEIIFVFVFLIGGLVASFICNYLLINFSHNLGIRNKNDVVVRWSNQSKPSLGGVSFYVALVFFTFTFSALFPEKNLFVNYKFLGLFTAGTIAFFMGLADDAFNTKPFFKLAIQILCGVALVYFDSIIQLTNIPAIDAFITITWVVLLMNSLNMLDNMDGITGTTSLFITIACLGANWILNGINFEYLALLNITMIGGLIGFLYFNINPSKLFMGDAGSQFIALFLAYISIDNLWTIETYDLSVSGISILIVLVCFTIPFSDTLTVVINRIKKGQSPMVGGKDHTTHHLVYAGYNDKQVWQFFTIINFIACLLAMVMVSITKQNRVVLIFSFVIFTLCVFGYLYSNTIKYKEKNKK